MNSEPEPFQWAIPEGLGIPHDPLELRLDFHNNAIVMYLLDKGIITTRVVSAVDIAKALMRDIPFSSGILPRDVLWWTSASNGPTLGLWREPQIWKVALITKALTEPRRLTLPMPGLIFVCSPGRPPAVYAAKKRPVSSREEIYHAPLFNVFENGQSCPGNHKYPADVSEIPESFFLSFFSVEGHPNGRSQKLGSNLLKLWEELDGKKRYPLSDLVKFGQVEDLIHENCRISR